MVETETSCKSSCFAKIKTPIKNAIIAYGKGERDNALGELHDAHYAAAKESLLCISLSYLKQINVLQDIAGKGFSDIKEELIKLTPAIETQQHHINFYMNAAPIIDLIDGFRNPPHYEMLNGQVVHDLKIHSWDKL